MPALERVDREALLMQSKVLAAFLELDRHMSVYIAQTIIAIALRDEPAANKNYSLTELADIVGIPQPTMSRVFKALDMGDLKLGPKGGLQMVTTYPDPVRYRMKRATLTRRGQHFVRKIINLIRE